MVCCRYCTHMHCEDVNYCDVRRKSFKFKTIINPRICDYYEQRNGDALGWNSGYKPRKKQGGKR